MSLRLGDEIIRTWPREDRKGAPMELENVAIVSVKMDADSGILYKVTPILRQARKKLANLDISIEKTVQCLNPGADSLTRPRFSRTHLYQYSRPEEDSQVGQT